MTKATETIIDESGIELLVGYEYDKSPSFHAEIGNPSTYVGEMVYTELTSVELVIAGVGLNILRQLTEKQKEHIISLLEY
jgi:hypothetical protein